MYNTVKAENLVNDVPVLHERSNMRYEGKITKSWYFKSKTVKDFRPLADLFLDENGQKRVPSNISELLTSRSMAYWIMDDGQQVARGE